MKDLFIYALDGYFASLGFVVLIVILSLSVDLAKWIISKLK